MQNQPKAGEFYAIASRKANLKGSELRVAAGRLRAALHRALFRFKSQDQGPAAMHFGVYYA
ncbi:hypothetical protein MJO29_004462 [Puccinia striiformis f. sp. tritici]|nr:hypothetical protein MJO29_004462 [Puccinia striiformis f. sp. tritici]